MEEDTKAWLMQLSETELRVMTVELDRCVTIQLASNDGQRFGFSEVQHHRLKQQEKHNKRWQRRLARREAGSGRWVKAN